MTHRAEKLSEHEVTQRVQRANRRHELRVTLVAALLTNPPPDGAEVGDLIKAADVIIDALEARHLEERRG